MKIKYGAMNFPIKPVIREIEDLGSLGLDYIELAMDAPLGHHAVVLEQKDQILHVLNELRLGLVCHLPTFVYTADPSPAIRKASVDEMIASLEVAAELNAHKIVVHPSIVNGLGRLTLDVTKTCAMQSLESIVHRAQQLNIRLCLENMFPNYGYYYEPDHFSEIFDRFPQLDMTLDIGHANIDGDKDRRIFDLIECFSDKICHIHLSDNNGKFDEHLPLGHGNIQFQKVAQALMKKGYNQTVTLEVFDPDRRWIAESKNRFSAFMK